MKRATLIISCLILLNACSNGGSSGNGTPVSEGSSAPTSAAEVAQDIKASVRSVQKVVTVTEDNDPNNKIGRPNGYVSAAVLYDAGADCGEDLGVDCGATVEVWPSANDAKERSAYIQDLQKNSPVLGSEYDYLDGATLLRVTGNLKPSVAKEYKAAFSSR